MIMSMKRSRLVFVFIVMVFATAPLVRSEISLASFSYTGTGQASGPVSWQPFLSYGDPIDVSPLGFMNNATLTLLDIVNGTYFDLAGDFANFSSEATDDGNDSLYIGFFVPGGTGSTSLSNEMDILAGASFPAPGVGAPDFNGYMLTRVSVIGTSFQTLPDNAFQTTFEFTVYGDVVPEPSALALLSIGLAMVVQRARRRQDALVS